MTIQFRKRFLKDLAQLPSKPRELIEGFAFQEINSLTSLSQSGKIEQLKGYPGFYKIRFGDYRVGLRADGDVVIFERALHRKDIYRFFP